MRYHFLPKQEQNTSAIDEKQDTLFPRTRKEYQLYGRETRHHFSQNKSRIPKLRKRNTSPRTRVESRSCGRETGQNFSQNKNRIPTLRKRKQTSLLPEQEQNPDVMEKKQNIPSSRTRIESRRSGRETRHERRRCNLPYGRGSWISLDRVRAKIFLSKIGTPWLNIFYSS